MPATSTSTVTNKLFRTSLQESLDGPRNTIVVYVDAEYSEDQPVVFLGVSAFGYDEAQILLLLEGGLANWADSRPDLVRHVVEVAGQIQVAGVRYDAQLLGDRFTKLVLRQAAGILEGRDITPYAQVMTVDWGERLIVAEWQQRHFANSNEIDIVVPNLGFSPDDISDRLRSPLATSYPWVIPSVWYRFEGDSPADINIGLSWNDRDDLPADFAQCLVDDAVSAYAVITRRLRAPNRFVYRTKKQLS